MSRTRISRDLEPLPRATTLKSNQNRTGSLLQILRSLALKNQREQPRVFYSLREVGNRFNVPISTVVKIYRDLEQEGLLSRVRSSKTVLNGLRASRRVSVRGLVGLPTLTSHFLTIPDYRRFLICIRRELWLRGFATTMFFVRDHEVADGTLTDQLKSHEVDTVIWFQPGRSARESILRLSDMGVRAIIISEVGTPGIPSRYFIWRETAIEALLKDWRDRKSVREIIMVNSGIFRSTVTEEVSRLILQALEIESVIQIFSHEDSSVFLRDLCRIKTNGIIFPVAGLVSMFAFRNPDELIELTRSRRVAFIDGTFDIPFAKIPDVPIDLVTVNWQAVAESIVNDLITREAFDGNRYTTFQADARFGVPLNTICDEVNPARSIAASI